MDERFYVVEHEGHMTADANGGRRAAIEVMVLDRDYCHRVMWSSASQDEQRNRVRDSRVTAHRLASLWNAEHAEALA